MFNEKSYLVKIWLEKIQDADSEITVDDVPELFNLKDVVLSLIKNKE